MHRDYHPSPAAPARRPFRWRWLALAAIAAWMATGLFSVQPNEIAVVQRCGRALAERRPPGLHAGFPWPIDRVHRVKMLEQKRVGVGVMLAERELGRRVEPQQAECLTGDRNIILVSAVVQYHIEDPYRYLFQSRDTEGLIRSATAGALAAVVSSMKVDDVLTIQRVAVQNEVKQRAQQLLADYGAGVWLNAVSLEGVSPPQEVAEAFRDVAAAREDAQTARNEADGYRNRLGPKSRAEAEQIRLEAEGYAAEVVERATGDADRFRRMAGELSSGRELTIRRLILETLEEVLPRLAKVLVDGPEKVDLGIVEERP
jgi:membrane protease subunit HflK